MIHQYSFFGSTSTTLFLTHFFIGYRLKHIKNYKIETLKRERRLIKFSNFQKNSNGKNIIKVVIFFPLI